MRFMTAVSLGALLLLGACGTPQRNSQSVTVRTPGFDGAHCTLKDEESTYSLVTPGSAIVAKTGQPLGVTCTRDGYEGHGTIASHSNGGKIAGALLLTGVIGLAAASHSGDIYEYDQVTDIAMTKAAAPPNPVASVRPPSQNTAPGPAASPSPASSSAPRQVAAVQPSGPAIRGASSGQKQQIGFVWDLARDCSSLGRPTLKVVATPEHGSVSIEPGENYPSFNQNNPRYVCNDRKVPVTVIYYQSQGGFIGSDQFTVDQVNPDGEFRHLTYAINVR